MGKALVRSQEVSHSQSNTRMALIVSLRRPYLHMYARSNELEEVGVVSLAGTNVESDPQKEMLLGVSTKRFVRCHGLIRLMRRNLSLSRSLLRRTLTHLRLPTLRSSNLGYRNWIPLACHHHDHCTFYDLLYHIQPSLGFRVYYLYRIP